MKNLLVALLWLLPLAAGAQLTLTVNPGQRGAEIGDLHYGIFFEEINHAGDGGLYAELIRNRSFEDSNAAEAWSTEGRASISITSTNLLNSTQQQALSASFSAASGAVVNSGYWGMKFRNGEKYTFSAYLRPTNYSGNLRLSLRNDSGTQIGQATISVSKSSEWKKYTATITATGDADRGSFAIVSTAAGTLQMDVVSLFPPTFKNRPNGCRQDLAQMLADMKPKFMRFPGGCFIEGQARDGQQNRFEWKKTIGAIEDRPGHWNVNWNYRVSDGLGFHEMLQLAEDLGAAPLFVVNIGLGHGWMQPYDDIQEYIQEALDALEYANGSTSTTYGAMRAANGHPEPFNLKLIEIGNENYQANSNEQSDHYAERYYQFYQAIKAAYPDVKCIGNVESWGTDNPSWRNPYPTDAVDEHYYRNPEWFVKAFTKYDSYNRQTSPKVYAGEYAVTSNFGTTGNLAAALGEAIYMQGMEKNSDLCVMASYAPIFVNENDQRWMPDMIRFNSSESYGTPSYYVQKLMPNHLGRYNVAVSEQGNTSVATHHVGLSTWLTAAEFKDYTVTMADGTTYTAPFNGESGWTSQGGDWSENNGILAQYNTGMEGKLYLNETLETGDNYTIHLKATKTDGREGFLIAFNIQDSKNYVWWNLGGWSNSQHAVEVCTNGNKATVASRYGGLETGKEYDIKVIVEGGHVQCFLDNELYHDFYLPIDRKVYATATVDADNGKLYLKVTNPNAAPANAVINMSDYHVTDAKLIQLASASDQDENTNDNHYNVVPTENTLTVSGSQFLLNIPAYSFNIIECTIAEGEEAASNGIQVQEGISYLVFGNENQLLSRGNEWGTHAVLDDYGVPVERKKVENGYTLRYADLGNKFLGLTDGNHVYSDISGEENTTWRFIMKADGELTLQHAARGFYLKLDDKNNLIVTDNESEALAVKMISVAERNSIIAANEPTWEENIDKCEYEDITEKKLQNPDFNPINDSWNVSMSRGVTLRAGLAEVYEGYGTVEQVVTGLAPEALYRFSLQGFVRNGDVELLKQLEEQGFTLANAYLYAGDYKKPLPAWTTGYRGSNWPNTMEQTAEAFAEGLYKAEVVGRTDKYGNLKVGIQIPQNNSKQWVIWGPAKLESMAEPIDCTDKISDPSFEAYGSGWSVNGMQMQTNNEPSAMKDGNVYCEKWTQAPWSLSNASVVQEVTGLSNGTYIVKANCHAEMQGSNQEISGVYLFAGDNATAVGKPATYTVRAEVTDNKLTIGYKAENCNANWITVDDFHLTLVSKMGEVPQPEVDFRLEELPVTSYLFAYFPSNNDENLYYAHSVDGFNYTPLNDGHRVMASDTVSIKGGIRDPHVIRGVDGKTFYMVATDMRCAEGWDSNRGIVMYRSQDLINWTHSTVHFPERFPEKWRNVTRVWAPETIWDPDYQNEDGTKGRYMVYFSLLTNDGTCPYDKVFYCYANDDFTDLITEPRHLFDRGRSTIDADIVYDERDGLYHMIYKNEGDGGICHVSAASLTAPEGMESTQWSTPSGGIQQTSVAVEGGGLFRLINSNKWVVMYDCYTSGYYQFCTTMDWQTYLFKQNTVTSGAFTPRHGSVIQLTTEEAERLFNAFPTQGYNPTLPEPVYDNSAEVASLVINEIQACNVDYVIDPSFNYGSWIEIYNPTDKPCKLDRVYITDKAKDLKKEKLSSLIGAVPAHGYKNIWFDHKGPWNKGEQAQVDFKLSNTGGTIILSDGEKILLQQDYPAAIGRTSYARTTDGGDTWGTSANPTPEASNSGMKFAEEQLPVPVVDTESKTFSGNFSFNVIIPEGMTLRYTTDGSAPTEQSAVSTDGRFNVNDSQKAFRFRLFKEGYLPSEVVTRAFIKDNNSLPIISIVTDRAKNIDSKETGIFVKGPNGRPGNGQDDNCNWNMDWDRPVNFDYITEDNQCVVSQEVNMEVSGGWSRAWDPRSFKLKAAKYYQGLNSIDYPFFSNKPFLKHKTLQIRNGGNSGVLKDASLQEIMRRSGLNIETQSWVPVKVYINGSYHGQLNMREPNNKHYGSANYGIDTDLMDQFEMSPDSGYVQKEGTKEAWDRLIQLSADAADSETYTEIGKLLDIDQYINYMAAEFYLENWDWPQNNVKAFRDQEDGQFHFVVFDLDGAFNNATFYTFRDKKIYTFDALRGNDPSGKWTWGTRMTKEIEFVTLFENMLKNETFRRRFVDAFCVIGGSTFHPDFVKPIVNEMATRMNYWNNDPQNTLTTKRQENLAARLKNGAYDFGVNNANTVKATLASSMEEATIYVNDMPVPTNHFSGTLYMPITVKAIVPAGYKFKGWKSAATANYISTDAEYTLPNNNNVNLIADFSPISEEDYTAENGVNPVRINEISADNSMYVNDYFKKDDWVELYNTTDQPIDIAGMYISDDEKKPKKFQIPEDSNLQTIIEPHGHLVIWASKRDIIGEQIHMSFKLGNKGGEILMLTSKDETWSDMITYPAHRGDETVGRYPDGANQIYKMQRPTINNTNCLTSFAQYLYSTPYTRPTDTAIEALTTDNPAAITAITYYDLNGIPRGTFHHNSTSPGNTFHSHSTSPDATLTTTLNTLPPGIYIIKYTLANGEVKSKKVVR